MATLPNKLFPKPNAILFVKRLSPVVLSFFSLIIIAFTACTRIDTTTLGSDLIPAVDNIHTFDTTITVETDNFAFVDSTRVFATEDLPLGYINDPEFGTTKADFYFSVSPPSLGTYPFGKKDSLVMDSVVLSLAYKGAYGDTNTTQTVRVFEVSQTSGFKDTNSLFRLDHPDFATTGPELGSRTFVVNTLNDSVEVRRKDTVKVKNVLRIKLDTALGRRFMNYDTTSTANGGYKTDSIFKTLFRGLAIKADASGNALTYFNPDDDATSVIVYYHYGRPDSMLVTEFKHSFTGLTNSLGAASTIRRTPGGNFNTYLNNGTPLDDKLYIQSTPGSYATIKIPGLETLPNMVVHRAELIATIVPSISDNIFTPPGQLFLDMINNTKDTFYTIQNDFQYSPDFGVNYDVFGGILKNGVYNFNISRHVQGIVTRHERNFTLRLHAPYDARPYYLPPGKLADFNLSKLNIVSVAAVNQLAHGRVVVGGGNNANPALKMRLHIIYSKI